MTLEMLIAWHQQREGKCFAILARATHMPKAEAEALKATAQFHIEAVRLLQTVVQGGNLKRQSTWRFRTSSIPATSNKEGRNVESRSWHGPGRSYWGWCYAFDLCQTGARDYVPMDGSTVGLPLIAS
jgi:hypothetical protein